MAQALATQLEKTLSELCRSALIDKIRAELKEEARS